MLCRTWWAGLEDLVGLKRRVERGLISENRAPGAHASYFFFLCVRTCIQDVLSRPYEMWISLPKSMVLCGSWWAGLEDLVGLKRRVQRGSYRQKKLPLLHEKSQ